MVDELTPIKWTRFSDMSSGGGQKEDYHHIFIEAPEEEATRIFYIRFGHNPDRVTCTCCGPDYSIDECDSLREATAYHRNCGYNRGDGSWVEERNRDMDKYVFERLNLFDPQVKELLAMARQNVSPNEAKIAADKLMEKYGGSYYQFIPFAQFEQDFALSHGGKALVIRASDFTDEERVFMLNGNVPEEGYVWQ